MKAVGNTTPAFRSDSEEIARLERLLALRDQQIADLTDPQNVIKVIRRARQLVREDSRSCEVIANSIDGASNMMLRRFVHGKKQKCWFLINKIMRFYGEPWTISSFDPELVPDSEWQV